MLRGLFRRRSKESADYDETPPDEEFGPPEEFADMITDDASEFVRQDQPADQPTQLVVRYRVMLMILLLLVAVVVIAVGALDQIPADIMAQWPWLLVVVGALWLLVGLVTAWPHGTLGGPGVIAVGVIALLGEEIISPTAMTFAGAIIVALGVAVILRGLTMPRARG